MTTGLALPIVTDCWNSIGVKGDRTCPKLVDAIHCHNCDVFAAAARAFLDRPAPVEYVGEVSTALSRSVDAKPTEAVSAVVFEVGDQLFAIDTKAVVEVTSPRTPHRIGHRSGRVFAGIVNIHGQLELCCSLAGLLQIDAAGSVQPGARMLLVEHGGLRWSFEVGGVHGVHRFESSEVSPAPATLQHETTSYVQAVLHFGERRAGHLDLDRTFRALETSVR
jgi:chemotaxis-related protein WspD